MIKKEEVIHLTWTRIEEIGPDRYWHYMMYMSKDELTHINDNTGQTIPADFRLNSYPNPFNSNTVITLKGGEGGDQVLEIFDITGAVEKELKYGYDNNGNRVYEVAGVDSTHYFYADSVWQYFQDYASVESDTIEGWVSQSFVPATLDTVNWNCDLTGGPRALGSFEIYSVDSTYASEGMSSILGFGHSGSFVPASIDTIWVRVQITRIDGTTEASGSATFTNEEKAYSPTNKLDHLTGQSDSNYTYDLSGRLKADGGAVKSYTYNDLGQLATYSRDNHDRLFFAYDYSGARVKKTVITGNLCDYPDTCGSGAICDTIPAYNCQCDSLAGYIAGDANGNCIFNGIDATYLQAWLKSEGPPPPDPLSRADANCSGTVNGLDVTYIANYFKGGPAPGCCFWNCADTVTTYYIYGNGGIMAEYDDSGNLTWNYLYGMGQRLARFKGKNKQVYHNDHLGSARALTDTAGAIVSQVDYYPFGEEMRVTGAPGRFTYNGKELDDEYGFDLYYYGARYMDPKTGRFTTPDPVKDFLNPYSYVGNKPVNRIDPTGAKSGSAWRWDTCTKGYFGGIPDFFLAKSRQQRIKILNGQIDPAEIEWRASMLDKANDQSDDIKSPPTSQEGEVNVTDAPVVPGHPDYIGPTQERPDDDKKLTWDEVVWWWRHGNGGPLFVYLKNIGLSGVSPSEFDPVKKEKNVSLIGLDFGGSIDEAKVYGQFKLTLIDENTVKATWGYDKFDVEQHEGGGIKIWVRNKLTKWAENELGPGTPFTIWILGTANIREPYDYFYHYGREPQW